MTNSLELSDLCLTRTVPPLSGPAQCLTAADVENPYTACALTSEVTSIDAFGKKYVGLRGEGLASGVEVT